MPILLEPRLTSTIFPWSGALLYAMFYAVLYFSFNWSPRIISTVSLGLVGPIHVFFSARARSAKVNMRRAMTGKVPSTYAEVVSEAVNQSIDPETLRAYRNSQMAHMFLTGAIMMAALLLFLVLKP